MEDLQNKWHLDRAFHPNMTDEARAKLYKGWQKAVERTMGWEE
jgi:glycerol kinase